MYIDSRQSRCIDTESRCPATASITGPYELGEHVPQKTENVQLLDVPKESLPRAGRAAAWDESYMALTFGTLLSSQGADAHRHGPFRPIGGNPRYVTRSVSQ